MNTFDIFIRNGINTRYSACISTLINILNNIRSMYQLQTLNHSYYDEECIALDRL